ncbi:MAG: FliH/SctL family protein [Nitrospiria bacterium]
MSWFKIMKPDASQDLQISEYALEEFSSLNIEKNKPAKAAHVHVQNIRGDRIKEIEAEPGSIGGKLSAIERDAYERGFASGERAGHALGMKKVDAQYRHLEELIEIISDLQEEILKTATDDILTLTLAIAQRVLHQELSHRWEYVNGYIHEAIKKIGPADSIKIRIHPQNLEKLTSERTELIESVQGLKSINFQADENLLPGECIVESRDRTVDARLESQLSIIEQELNNRDGKT